MHRPSSDRFPRRSPALSLVLRGILVTAVGATAAACSAVGPRSDGIDPKYGVPASRRVVAEGEPVPPGGGTYKIGKPYRVAGLWYVPREEPGYDRTGVASWYGRDFHGRLTANGEIFDRFTLSAAHPTLPIPSYARVTNLRNGRSVVVRINNRGPYSGNRLIDLSEKTAEVLGFKGEGLTTVRVQYIGRAPLGGSDQRMLIGTLRGPTEVASLDQDRALLGGGGVRSVVGALLAGPSSRPSAPEPPGRTAVPPVATTAPTVTARAPAATTTASATPTGVAPSPAIAAPRPAPMIPALAAGPAPLAPPATRPGAIAAAPTPGSATPGFAPAASPSPAVAATALPPLRPTPLPGGMPARAAAPVAAPAPAAGPPLSLTPAPGAIRPAAAAPPASPARVYDAHGMFPPGAAAPR